MSYVICDLVKLCSFKWRISRKTKSPAIKCFQSFLWRRGGGVGAHDRWCNADVTADVNSLLGFVAPLFNFFDTGHVFSHLPSSPPQISLPFPRQFFFFSLSLYRFQQTPFSFDFPFPVVKAKLPIVQIFKF